MVESSNKVAARAVELLRKAALVSEIPKTKIASQIGARRQSVAARFEKGDMKMTDYLKTANAIGVNPVEILQEATDANK
ncbi:MAG: hypothetical protein LKJ05_02655 [Bifidobacteriaceae bacterium]|jgi:DNA-binding XRE family transcriptional regulator|nr:hypothetical protein [Bifidobacteriaceae bacterium]